MKMDDGPMRPLGAGVFLRALLLAPAMGTACTDEVDPAAASPTSAEALSIAPAAEDEAAPEATPFSARVLSPSAASGAGSEASTLEVASNLDRAAEVALDLRALDETQQAQVTVALGALAANETRSFRIPLEALGLQSAVLRVGGAITLTPRLRDVDGLLTPRQDGPLVIGYHFEGPTLRAYDMATRASVYSGGRLDGVPWDGIVVSPARVVERGPPVPGEDDAEPDPDHELAREAP